MQPAAAAKSGGSAEAVDSRTDSALVSKAFRKSAAVRPSAGTVVNVNVNVTVFI